MLRKLLAAGIVFVLGYIVGVIFGFRSAVVDYVENDAESIQSVANDIYPSEEDGLPPEVVEALDGESDSSADTGATADSGGRAFH